MKIHYLFLFISELYFIFCFTVVEFLIFISLCNTCCDSLLLLKISYTEGTLFFVILLNICITLFSSRPLESSTENANLGWLQSIFTKGKGSENFKLPVGIEPGTLGHKVVTLAHTPQRQPNQYSCSYFLTSVLTIRFDDC